MRQRDTVQLGIGIPIAIPIMTHGSVRLATWCPWLSVGTIVQPVIVDIQPVITLGTKATGVTCVPTRYVEVDDALV